MDKIVWKRDTIISLEFFPWERSTFVQEIEFSHVFAIMVFSESINLFRFTVTTNLWSLVIDGKLITPKPIKIFLLFKPNIPYRVHSSNPLVILSQIIPFLNSHPNSLRSIFRRVRKLSFVMSVGPLYDKRCCGNCHSTAYHVTMYFYWLIPQYCSFSKDQHKIPEDGPIGPKHVRANIEIF
jgi:hypothetical protein